MLRHSASVWESSRPGLKRTGVLKVNLVDTFETVSYLFLLESLGSGGQCAIMHVGAGEEAISPCFLHNLREIDDAPPAV